MTFTLVFKDYGTMTEWLGCWILSPGVLDSKPLGCIIVLRLIKCVAGTPRDI